MDNIPKINIVDSQKSKQGSNIPWWLNLVRIIAVAYKSIRTQSVLKKVEQNYSFLIFLTLVGLVYIFNALHAERQATYVDKLQKEIKELKSEFMTLNAKLSKSRKQSEITLVADTIGLKLRNDPPFKLVVKTEK